MGELVSVVIPAYNHERYVADAIRSVIEQDYADMELVIINDGSTDETDEVIRSLVPACERRFVRFEYINQQNRGVAATMNRGVAWCRSEYVTSVSSDDLMLSGKVSELYRALSVAGPEVAIAYGDALFVDEEGVQLSLDEGGNRCVDGSAGFAGFIGFYTRHRSDLRVDELFSYANLIRGNFLPGMAMMWRKSCLDAVGGFVPGVVIEDWDLWLRLARRYRGVAVNKPLAKYRWHPENTVRTGVARLLKSTQAILRREIRLNRENTAMQATIARQIAIVAMHQMAIGEWRALFTVCSPDVLAGLVRGRWQKSIAGRLK